MLFIAFEKSKGLEAFLNLYKRYQTCANDLLAGSVGTVDGKKPETGLTVVQVFAGLKVAIELLQRLSSHRTLLESPQTALLLTREKNRSSPDYFDPHAFLVRLRAAILPIVVTTWEVSWIRQSPPIVVRATVGTLINILRAEGETSADPTTVAQGNPIAGGMGGMAALLGLGGGLGGGALGGLGGLGVPPPGPFVLDESKVTQLADMGFPRSAAVTALTRYRNNLGLATEYLLQRPDLVATARDADAAQVITDAAAATAAAALPPVAVPDQPIEVDEEREAEVPEEVEETLDGAPPAGLGAFFSVGGVPLLQEVEMSTGESALSEAEKLIKATKVRSFSLTFLPLPPTYKVFLGPFWYSG